MLVQMTVENHSQSLTLSASEIMTSGATERLVSLHNIQTELDGMQLEVLAGAGACAHARDHELHYPAVFTGPYGDGSDQGSGA